MYGYFVFMIVKKEEHFILKNDNNVVSIYSKTFSFILGLSHNRNEL